jgi:hypothetical protein
MWKLLLEAVLGRRRVRALRRLAAGATVMVMVFVPGAAAAILRIAIHEEQEQVTPLFEQLTHVLSKRLGHGHRLHVSHAAQLHGHR